MDRDYLKENYPGLYNLLGGERADKYTEKNLNTLKKVSGAADTVKDVAVKSFDIVVWIKENWQLAILGVVALLVLLRD